MYTYIQQLLRTESYSYGEQVTLDTSTTSQSHIDCVQDVPSLPLPLVNSKLTRVTFATRATPPIKGNSPLSGTNLSLTKPRASSFNVPTSKDMAKAKSLSSQSTEDLNFTRMNLAGLGEHLKAIETKNQSSLTNLIVGAQDYDSSRSGTTAAEWEELEMKAAAGCQGVLHENFTPSTLAMDCTTDNSRMPHCVVNGECAWGQYSIQWYSALCCVRVWGGASEFARPTCTCTCYMCAIEFYVTKMPKDPPV